MKGVQRSDSDDKKKKVEGEMECGQSGVSQEARKASADYWISAQITTEIFCCTGNIQCIHSGIKVGLHENSLSLSFSLYFRGWEKTVFS